MRKLSEGEKKILSDGVHSPFWMILRELYEDCIHEESLQQLQTAADKTLEIQKFKSRREAFEEVVKAPYELSK